MDEEINYEKLGFKSGLEIHQQLDTKKLFCNCPSVLRGEEPDYVVTRKLHPVAGEEGSIDIAAEYQASLGQEFIYQGYDTTCLVELDEEPPHEINKEALKICIQISSLLNCKILPITQIMRKTVIDGSNTSGFQRSVLIAKDGWVETSSGRVGIDSICLEEDAARIVERTDSQVIFRLDRLGIPLVEIATSPDIRNPEQIREVALHIGKILRSCKVRRGIGTIRQDVNISVKGHKRVEIKGFQDVKMFVKTAENEIKRQIEDIKNKKTGSEVRKALPNGETEFIRPMPGSARMYPETDLPLLKISKQMIDEAKKTLPKLKDEIEGELKEKGLKEEMIKLLFKEQKIDEFKELLNILNNPNLIAKILFVFPKEIAKKEGIEKKRIEKFLNKDAMVFVLESLKNKKISENQIKEILLRISKGTNPKDAVVFKKEDSNIIEERIVKLIKEKPGLSGNAYMGVIMNEFKGKISGKEVMELIKRHV
jgi:Glu-tRNA(Gln) amidotransferase subunit E-like FAD-binding protein